MAVITVRVRERERGKAGMYGGRGAEMNREEISKGSEKKAC